MTVPEMKAWIDGSTCLALLGRWRNASIGSPWFLGTYFKAAMDRKRDETSQSEQVAASKAIGWK